MEGWPQNKFAATLKVHKWHAQNVYSRLVKGLCEPYQSLLSAFMSNRTVNFAGNIANQQVAKTSQLSIYSSWCKHVLASFPSCLVGFWGFHPYIHLFSFRKLFCDLLLIIRHWKTCWALWQGRPSRLLNCSGCGQRSWHCCEIKNSAKHFHGVLLVICENLRSQKFPAIR